MTFCWVLHFFSLMLTLWMISSFLIFTLIWAPDYPTFLLLISFWVLALFNLTVRVSQTTSGLSSLLPLFPVPQGAYPLAKLQLLIYKWHLNKKKSLTLAFYPFFNSIFQLFCEIFLLNSFNKTVTKRVYYCFYRWSLFFSIISSFSHLWS